MGAGPEGGPMGPMGPNQMGPVLNGDGLDGMKNSPANGGPGTPREDSGSGMGDYNLGGFGGPGENVSTYFSLLNVSENPEKDFYIKIFFTLYPTSIHSHILLLFTHYSFTHTSCFHIYILYFNII